MYEVNDITLMYFVFYVNGNSFIDVKLMDRKQWRSSALEAFKL